MTWTLRPDGLVPTCPIAGWTIAPVADMAVLVRVEFFRSEEKKQEGARESEQLILTPAQALDLAEALRTTAQAALAPQPASTPRN